MNAPPVQTLLLRCDASAAAGNGHVMRSLALAQAWRDAGGQVVHLGVLEPGRLRSRLEEEGIRLQELAAEPGSAADAEHTCRLAREHGAAWVVLDGYRFAGDYQRAVAKAAASLLVIDDFGSIGEYFATAILDPNFGTSENWYAHRPVHTRLLLGGNFALHRREFARWRNWRRVIPPVGRRVLVTLGGSDPDNATGEVVAALALVRCDGLEVKVVVGGGSPHRGALGAAVAAAGQAFELLFDVGNLDELLAWADLGITAGGLTSWERALLGLPGLVLVLAENQRLGAAASEEAGAARDLGWATQIDRRRLASAIEDALADYAWRVQAGEANCRLVDGRGAERVVAALRECFA